MKHLFLLLLLTTPFFTYANTLCTTYFSKVPATLLSLDEVQRAYLQMDRAAENASRAEFTKSELANDLYQVRSRLAALKNSVFSRLHKWTGQIANLEKQVQDLEKQVEAYDARKRNDEIEMNSAKEVIIQQNRLARELSSQFAGYPHIEASLKKALLKNPEDLSRKFELENTVKDPNLEVLTTDGSMVVKEIDSRRGIALLKSKIKLDVLVAYYVDFFVFYDFRNQKIVLSGFEVDSKNVFSQFFMDPASLYKGPASFTNFEKLASQSGQQRPQDFNKTAARLKTLSPSLTSEHIGATLRAYHNNPTVQRQMDYALPLLEKKAVAEQAKVNRRSYRQSQDQSSAQASSQSSLDFWIFYWILIADHNHPEYQVRDQTLMQISLVPEAERGSYIRSATENSSFSPENQTRFEQQLERSLAERLEIPEGQNVEQLIERPLSTPSDSSYRDSDTGSRDTDYSRDSDSGSRDSYDSSSYDSGGGSFGD